MNAFWLDSVWQDLRFAARMLRRSPGATASALLTLGVGIGATTAMFSVADAVALRPLPYDEPDRLFAVHSRATNRDRVSTAVAAQDFLAWRDHQTRLEGIALISGGQFHLVEGEPEELRGCRATGDLFAVLGARPLIGTVFGREHEVEGHDRVVVLSYGFWQRRFAGDPRIVGRGIALEDGVYEVLGVMPADFKHPAAGRTYDLWAPHAFTEDQRSGRAMSGSGAVLRLKEDVSPAQAEAEIAALSAALPPDAVSGSSWRPILIPLERKEVGPVLAWMVLLLGAAGFVLLVACANVAHLTLARLSARRRELAVRTALGVGPGRLARQIVTENLLLSAGATLFGIVLAWWGVRVLSVSVPPSLRQIGDIGLDGRVLGFAIAAGAVTGLISALLPALRAWRAGVEDLKEYASASGAGRKGRRVRETLAFTEVALSFVLLAGASLFMLSFVRLTSVDPGFDTANLVTLRISVPREVNHAGGGIAAAEALLDRLRALPGVSGAGIVRGGWMFGGGRTTFPAHRPGEPRPGADGPVTDLLWVSPGAFQVLGVPILRGRDIGSRDVAGSQAVAVVNERAARRFWPDEDAVGRHLVIVDRTYEVIGVVRDIAHVGSDPGPRPELYMALAQRQGDVQGSFVVRTTGDPAGVMPGIRQATHRVWPHQPISRLATLEDDIERAGASRRFNMLLMAVFGVLALAIALSGLNGVMNCSVEQRRHEMAVRVALGARRSHLLALVLGRAALIVLAGVAAGAGAAWALGEAVQAYLFEVQARNGGVLLFVGLLMVIVAVMACWPPALRASRADPITTLKAE